MKKTLAVIMLVIIAFVFAYAKTEMVQAVPKTYKARSIDGVIQIEKTLGDVMGWEVTATSQKNDENSPDMTADMNAWTAWISRKKDSGVGESVTLKFDERFFAPVYKEKAKAVRAEGVRIISGIVADEAKRDEYSRPQEILITHNKKTVCQAFLYDNASWQKIKFPKALTVKPNDRISIKILSVYPVQLRDVEKQVAITEIAVDGDIK